MPSSSVIHLLCSAPSFKCFKALVSVEVLADGRNLFVHSFLLVLFFG